jgi:hypothetical protein
MKLLKEFERIMPIDRLGDRITDFNPTEARPRNRTTNQISALRFELIIIFVII